MKKLVLFLALIVPFFVLVNPSISLSQVSQQDIDKFKGIATGTDTYSVTISPVTVTTPYDGSAIWVFFTNANTGASTVAVTISGGNTYSAKAIRKDGVALVSGDIPALSWKCLKYYSSGGYYQLINPTYTGGGGSGTVTSVSAGINLSITAGTSTVNPTLSLIAAPTISGTNITVLPLSTGVTGTLPLTNGGTNSTTANGGLNNLLPTQTSNSGKYLTTDGTNSSWSTVSGSTQWSTASSPTTAITYTVGSVGINTATVSASLDIKGAASTTATTTFQTKNSSGSLLQQTDNGGRTNFGPDGFISEGAAYVDPIVGLHRKSRTATFLEVQNNNASSNDSSQAGFVSCSDSMRAYFRTIGQGFNQTLAHSQSGTVWRNKLIISTSGTGNGIEVYSDAGPIGMGTTDVLGTDFYITPLNSPWAPSTLFPRAGFIGMGTTVPKQKLDIVGEIGISGTHFHTDTVNHWIGINNTAPIGLLDAKESLNGVSYIRCYNTNTGTSARSVFQSQSDGGAGLFGATGASYTGVAGWADSYVLQTSGLSGGIKFFNGGDLGDIQFSTTGTSAKNLLVKGTNGFVGVGASPNCALDITGEIAISGTRIHTDTTSAAQKIGFFTGAPNQRLHMLDNTNGLSLFNLENTNSGSSGRNGFLLTSNGCTAYITTTSTTYNGNANWADALTFQTTNASGGMLFYNGSSSKINFATTGVNDGNLMIDASGNVSSNISMSAPVATFSTSISMGAATFTNGVATGIELHTISTPTTAATVTLVKNKFTAINPAGTIAALTINFPSSPSNNDFVQIKFEQIVTSVTYVAGTGGATILGQVNGVLGGFEKWVYDSGTNTWY